VIPKRLRLPHWEVDGQPQFVTFHLRERLPAQRVFPASSMTSGEAFAAMDRLLDLAGSGPTFLSQPAIAQLVLTSIDCGVALGRYEVHARVINAQSCSPAADTAGGYGQASQRLEGDHRPAREPAAGAQRQAVLAG
jgi:hypothetical protein